MSGTLNILIIGNFKAAIHEPSLLRAFEELGHNVTGFEFNDRPAKTKKLLFDTLLRLYYNLQIKLRFGPLVNSINKDLRKVLTNGGYDLILFYRPEYIRKETISNIGHKPFIFIYNNDDPFSKRYRNGFWKDYHSLLSECAHILYYRPSNKQDYENIGFTNTSLLRSYFINHLNYPIKVDKKNDYICDVAFIGHYEDDQREESIKLLVDNARINFKLFGPEWKRSKYYTHFVKKLGNIYPLGKDYNLAINSCKIALVFLSKLNNDSYTRRCFEIPAAGTFMLAEYSDDLNSLFVEGQEAEYFRSNEEMLNKIEYYINNPLERDKIAKAGYGKVHSGKHEIRDRAQSILDLYLNQSK